MRCKKRYSKKIGKGSAISKNFSSGVRDLQKVKNHCHRAFNFENLNTYMVNCNRDPE